MEDEVINFDPTQSKFAYMLSKYDCFRKLTGKCSLTLNEDEYNHYAAKEKLNSKDTYEFFEDNSVHYCRLLANSMIEKGIKKPVSINPFSCGHFAFTDGQHRTCIAKTIGLKEVPAYIGEAWECECRVCHFKKTNPIFAIRHIFGKTKEFIR
ncbi:hypothetical protein Elgi_37770 [Paenibacillus elgii]|uniref:ParB N-terminal domain-containing protein n=1 Tax=Paenibacillus elgii TaxID=189691 RepID=UPI002D7C6F1A|nr:hypothetical protein Elgi_37770 [Paenibacillus elgii]